MAPTVSQSREGAGIFGAFIGVLVWSIVGSLGVYSLDRVLPLWTKNAYFAFDMCFRAKGVIWTPHVSVFSKCKWILVSLALPSLVRFLVPPGRELLVYQGILAYHVPFLLVTTAWFMEDGPPGELRLAFRNSRNSTIAFTLGAIGATHPRKVWWFFVYIAAPLVSATAALYVPYLRTPVRWVLLRTAFPILRGISDIWDQLDIWEAHIIERIPRSLTHAWSRYQQRHPRRLKLPEYQYRRLKDGEIRLIILRKPKWFTGIINASIVHQLIDDPSLDYEAVSYRWGSSKRTDEILIDGCRFSVTKSAYDLLMARRSLWRDRVIWIDAICIHQDDDEEKGAQVQLMYDIYRRASRVVVYIGQDWRARYTAPLTYELVAAQVQYQGSDAEFANWTEAKLASPRWLVLIELFTNEYFNRAWIVQEIAAAQKVEIFYGGLYIPWEVFHMVLAFCARPQHRHLLATTEKMDMRLASGFQSAALDNITWLYLMRPQSGVVKIHEWDLESLLFATAAFRATDPRDKIFAVLGLVTDASRGLIKPDYTKSVEEVYESAARMILLHHPEKLQSVNLLALAGIGRYKRRQVVPSWVPDFMEERSGLPFTNPVGALRMFNAGGKSRAIVEPGRLSRTLNIRAIEADQVVGVSASGAYTIGNGESQHVSIFHIIRTRRAFVEGVIQLCMVHSNLWAAGEDVVCDRLWSALAAGRMQFQPIDSRFRDVFPCWRRQLEKLNVADDVDTFQPGVESDETDEEEEAATQRFKEDGSLKQYDAAVMESAYGRRFAVTAGGRLCLVPPLAEVSDIVVIPLGAQTPFLVRKEAPLAASVDESVYRLVGEAYVEGCMHGELMGDLDDSRWFQLI